MPEEQRDEPEYRNIKQWFDLLSAQDPQFKMLTDLAKSRGNRKNILPLTRENVLLAFAGIHEEVREQLTDLAIACFGRAHSPEFTEECIKCDEEEFYYQWHEEAALRVCNSRLDAFLIEISDRGTITRFKFKRPPFIVPTGWDHQSQISVIPDELSLAKLFDQKGQSRRRRKFGDVGDKYDLHGLAWKRD